LLGKHRLLSQQSSSVFCEYQSPLVLTKSGTALQSLL
jgi:hypothetical protein